MRCRARRSHPFPCKCPCFIASDASNFEGTVRPPGRDHAETLRGLRRAITKRRRPTLAVGISVYNRENLKHNSREVRLSLPNHQH